MKAPTSDSVLHYPRLQLWLRVDPQNKPKISAQIYESTDISSLNYWLEIIFSAGIATFGLVLNSPAVIIGAMLISPLMGPIMATGLALVAGDLYLGIKGVGNLLASVTIAIGLSSLFVWLLPFHSATSEILARTNPNLLDLGVALFSGLAGSVAVCRSGGAAGVTTLPGVAIAVALMPPLCTIGFGFGSGINLRIMGGAGMLFLTNLVAIVASAFVVFLLVGMNSPEVRVEMRNARQGEALARRLAEGPVSRALSGAGQLRWRILMLVILLGLVAIPLRTALLQVAEEAVARGAVQRVIRDLLPPGTMVSQQVEVGRENVVVRLIATQAIPEAKLREAEKAIEVRSGRKAEVSVASVASHSEIAELMQRLATPRLPAPPPAPKSLEAIRQELIDRIKPVVAEVWPPEAPLQDFDLSLAPTGMALNARYVSAEKLGQIPLDMIARALREKLSVPELTLNATRIAPPRETPKHSKKKAP
jgi:uncharacterized hydrophobic protein (TIGR00271 family)